MTAAIVSEFVQIEYSCSQRPHEAARECKCSQTSVPVTGQLHMHSPAALPAIGVACLSAESLLALELPFVLSRCVVSCIEVGERLPQPAGIKFLGTRVLHANVSSRRVVRFPGR